MHIYMCINVFVHGDVFVHVVHRIRSLSIGGLQVEKTLLHIRKMCHENILDSSVQATKTTWGRAVQVGNVNFNGMFRHVKRILGCCVLFLRISIFVLKQNIKLHNSTVFYCAHNST